MRKNQLISLFCFLWVLFSPAVQAQERTMGQPYALLKKIVINDSLSLAPLTDTVETERAIYVHRLTNIDKLTVILDSNAIQAFGLKEYQVYVNSPSSPDSWLPYPYKEFQIIEDTQVEIYIRARNKQGEIFAEKIMLYFPLGIFSSPIAWALYILLAGAFGFLCYYAFNYFIWKDRYKLEKLINTRTEELSLQKAQYEEMLTNYMPIEEFNKMKEKDKTTRFKMVTVLFSNVLGFTKIAEQENAELLIDDLDRFFFQFDDVVQKLHIEKIKSIGDSYMCAGGIPQKNRTNPIEVVLAAFEMQQYMDMLKNQYKAENKKIWELRMGIHTGPVFSNLSNKKRFEVWGDTVNIASRMEASGEMGKVNITGMTYELVKDYFMCRYLGKMPVKYKGEIDMYIIEGFRPALSVDGIGLKPNKAFKIRLGHIRFDDLEEHVMNILEEQLPRNLYYHNLKHTIDVTVQVEIIGRQEGVTDEELLILKTAALFHDTGFTRVYKDHEEMGVVISKEILPLFDYTQEQIDWIEELIMVTKLPPKPKNKLEQIMCDADLDYLGRVDFIPVSGNLFRELTEHQIIEDDINKWNQLQINFISNHHYFTETAKSLRDVNKNNQLEAIRRLVEEKN